MTTVATAEVLIVEDHPLYCDGVVSMLARQAPWLHCRVTSDASQALQLLQRSGGIDLLLVDHHLPGEMNGLELLERAGELYPTAARVLMSGHDDLHLSHQARRTGAMGFLPKSLTPIAWMTALNCVLDGEPWFPAATAPAAIGLTPRQVHILERVAAGQTNKLIARDMGVTERTVKYHLAEIYARLDAGSRAEAVARASARGWITLPARAA